MGASRGRIDVPIIGGAARNPGGRALPRIRGRGQTAWPGGAPWSGDRSWGSMKPPGAACERSSGRTFELGGDLGERQAVHVHLMGDPGAQRRRHAAGGQRLGAGEVKPEGGPVRQNPDGFTGCGQVTQERFGGQVTADVPRPPLRPLHDHLSLYLRHNRF